jgi:hypothetical protein
MYETITGKIVRRISTHLEEQNLFYHQSKNNVILEVKGAWINYIKSNV